jgi:uncharacterized membrane protein
MLVHLPGHLVAGLAGVQFTEFLLAAGAMAGFVLLGATVSWMVALPALAVYAAAPNLVLLATDGSSDTGTGALVLLAIIAVGWGVERGVDDASVLLAGMVGALAVSTKQIALPIILGLAIYLLRRHGWRPAVRYVVGAAAVLLLVSLPFLILGPIAYLRGLVSFIGVHSDIYGWNIWALARGLGLTPWDQGPATVLNVTLSVIALVSVAALPIRHLSAALLAGVVATLVILLSARWTTYAYFAMLAPVVLAMPAAAAWEGRRERAAVAT